MKKWYEKPKVIVLLLMLVFPAGLFLMFRYMSWPRDIKVCICLMLAGVIVMVLFVSMGWDAARPVHEAIARGFYIALT